MSHGSGAAARPRCAVHGLAAALALAHQGFPVHVLDRGRGSPRSRPRRAEPRRVRRAREPRPGDRPRGPCEPAGLLHADARTGSTLRVAELGPAVRARYGQPYLLVARSALRALFVAACDADEMVTSSTATGRVRRGPRRGRLVTAQDGDVFRAEALVAADGAFSRVRELLGGGHPVSAPYLRAASGPAVDDVLRLWSSSSLHVVQTPGRAGGRDVAVTCAAGPRRHGPRRDRRRRARPRQHVPEVRARAAGRARRHRRPAPPRPARAPDPPPDHRAGRRGRPDPAARGARHRRRSSTRARWARLRPRRRPHPARARRLRRALPARDVAAERPTSSPRSATPTG